MKFTGKIAAKILGLTDGKWEEKIIQNKKRKAKNGKRKIPKNEVENLVQES